MSACDDDALAPVVRALEELRCADRILATADADGRREKSPGAGWGSLFDFPSGRVLWEPAALRGHGEVLRAQVHVKRALALTRAHGARDGLADDGNEPVLHTAVGLRRAAREFFERLVTVDPRLRERVPPLGEW